jgi:two-component system, chemotaxis family, protein-glutamate methylesterase/glutaminase
MTETIRVLLADDSPTARALLRSILRDAGGFQVVGEAVNGLEAVDLTDRLEPDLILMDVHMPALDGIEATREIMSRSPRPIVIVSAATARDVDLSLNATQAGALLALPKPEGPSSPRFEEQRAELIRMARAMASVKVVRRWHAERRPHARPPVGRTGRGAAEVVAIAASTGGPPALRTILDGLPPDFPAPILIVQHIARDFSAGFADWLGGSGRLRARLADDGELLLPGTIYVAPDDRHLGVSREGCAVLSRDPPIGGFRPSASHLFASTGRVYGPRAMAVILTGMGDDGADGLEIAHAAGTFVVAQDEASSIVFGMARAAIERGTADCVLPLERIGPIIMERVTGSHEG